MFFRRSLSRGLSSGTPAHLVRSTLPFDVLGEIGFFLDGLQEKLNLCLASKTLYNHLLPYLYWSLEIYGTKNCFDCITFLSAHPHLARHVRTLMLHPNYLRMSNKKRLLDEARLAEELERIIPNLCSLEKIVWDGLELPPDGIWVAFRNSCPLLKYVGANLGAKDLCVDSELFSFQNLSGFSLTTELRDSNYRPSIIPSGESLPEGLWTMLLDRCPELETLVIGHRGAMHFSRRHIDVSPIIQAKWPQLRELTMENCRIFDSFESLGNSRALFSSFVKSHRKLTRLHLMGLPCLELDIYNPPFALQSYGSGLENNPYIAVATGSLRELNFTQQQYSGMFFRHICFILGSNLNVRKLTLAMDFSRDNTLEEESGILPQYNHIQELKSVVASCNRLEDLTVICSTKRKETFFYKDFPEVLRGSSLKRVELWKYHRVGDETPSNLALRIARENPSMERIVIRTLHQLWDKEYDPLRILQVGYYKVIRDAQGKPRHLTVNETGGETMAWMLTKRCTLPISTPRKWRSILKWKDS